jgi:uncharacterized protein (TIGR00369 family)
MPFTDGLTQRHGFFHAGALTSIVDSACDYAALTLMPAGFEVLTIEYKINFLAPASGTSTIVHGRVLKPGRTVMVCQGEVVTVNDRREKLCATSWLCASAYPKGRATAAPRRLPIKLSN